jgi:capsular exopolysaccharide synthesis family protein
LSLLGAIPPSDDVLADARDPKTGIGEALNVVRAGLSLASSEGAPRSIMVTSVQPGEGKTNTCLALAMSFARMGKRVVIMDLDLRRPNVHRLFKLQNKIGAANLLSGQADAAQVVRPSGIEGIDIITAGPIPPNPTELIMGQQLMAIMAELQSTYDIVFIDAPPVLALADAVILSSKVESTIFIIESGRNSPTALRSAVNRIAANGGDIVGGILTKYDPARMGYGYNRDYSYSYSYAESDRRVDDDN